MTTIRTAVTEAEVLARLAESPAELVLADTAITRPDTVGFTRRVLARAPQAVLVLLGPEEPRVAAAAVSAGARGLIRGGDHDLAGTVAKVLLLIGGRRSAPTEPVTAVAGRGASPAASAGTTGATSGAQSRPGQTGPAPDGGVGPVRPAGRADPSAGPAHAGPGQLPGGGDQSDAGRDPSAGAGPAPPAAEERRCGGRDVARSSGGGLMVPAQRVDPITGAATRRPPLTERELQVLRGMAEGKSNAEIGRDLYVSEDTVKTHARRLFRKLRARDRAHAVAVGFRSGALS